MSKNELETKLRRHMNSRRLIDILKNIDLTVYPYQTNINHKYNSKYPFREHGLYFYENVDGSCYRISENMIGKPDSIEESIITNGILTTVIERKKISGWKHAIGQLLIYRDALESEHDCMGNDNIVKAKLELVCDDQTKDDKCEIKNIKNIEYECDRLGMDLLIFKYDHDKMMTWQLFLPLTYIIDRLKYYGINIDKINNNIEYKYLLGSIINPADCDFDMLKLVIKTRYPKIIGKIKSKDDAINFLNEKCKNAELCDKIHNNNIIDKNDINYNMIIRNINIFLTNYNFYGSNYELLDNLIGFLNRFDDLIDLINYLKNIYNNLRISLGGRIHPYIKHNNYYDELNNILTLFNISYKIDINGDNFYDIITYINDLFKNIWIDYQSLFGK